MSDSVVGTGDKAKVLRQAISLATDTSLVNKTFYNPMHLLAPTTSTIKTLSSTPSSCKLGQCNPAQIEASCTNKCARC